MRQMFSCHSVVFDDIIITFNPSVVLDDIIITFNPESPET